jgi:hypothetical protein
MKLSELVGYRQHLQELTGEIEIDYLHREVDPILYSVANAPVPTPSHGDLLLKSRDEIQRAFEDLMHNLDQFKADFDNAIRQEHPA